jgi:hypothetical protein
MAPNIIFNGKGYESADEMPADVRRTYESIMGILADKDGDGTPDLLEGLPAGGARPISSMQVFFEGKMYTGVNELPPEARARYERAMSKLDRDKDGVIDFLQAPAAAAQTSSAAGSQVPQTGRPPLSPLAITEDKVDRRLLVAGVVIIVLLCAVAGLAALLFLR